MIIAFLRNNGPLNPSALVFEFSLLKENKTLSVCLLGAVNEANKLLS
jgi:hypothetical protein